MKNILLITLFSFLSLQAQTEMQKIFQSDKAEYSLNDFGKMWTFDDLPIDYWETEYGFTTTEDWIEDVMKSALQFGWGCSGAFVSANGLIMSNHHCARGGFVSVQKEGEDILKNGFYAAELEDERKIPNLFVDQLVEIWDVTDKVINSDNKKEMIDSLEAQFVRETGLTCRVVNLYNGNKFSMYGYKRYNDIRLVMAPEFQIASTGWDWDNFTYPRYELDFAFFRAYDEDGKPVNVENYFEWSEKGTEEDELIFTVGRPGSTERLISFREFEYQRDIRYPVYLSMFDEFYNVYFELFQKYPERESELLNQVMGIGNGKKAYLGEYKALHDSYVRNRKKAFEDDLRNKIVADNKLEEKYSHIFPALDLAFNELSEFSAEFYAFRLGSRFNSDYSAIAQKAIELINDSAKSEEKISKFIEEEYDKNIDEEKSIKITQAFFNLLERSLSNDHPVIIELNTNYEMNAAEFLNQSLFKNREELKTVLIESDLEKLNNDPLVKLINNSKEIIARLNPKLNEVNKTIDDLTKLYGESVFAVFGDKMSPDATSTLRISDGKVKRYEYNGTLAQPFTTFYGLYDRYFGFGKESYPWGLTPNWAEAYDDINLSTPLNFASTNDIVGGNSGSSIINKNAEVIGLVFDGNMESLYGNFIFLPETNRAVAVDSRGIIEALKKVYKAERLLSELLEK
ncbi:MAG: S46 family peptidase [Melioribacteraceae bacterium]|nr:S46 family peptidase [Melioribacteraceae bacterium]